MSHRDFYYHSQPSRRSGYNTKANTPVVSPVTTAELAEWLRLDDDSEPALTGLLMAATGFVIERLQSELINRARTVTYVNWPTVGNEWPAGLSVSEAMRKSEIVLPYATLQSVESVELYGEAFTAYVIQDTTPAQLLIESVTFTGDYEQPAIKVEYTAGYGADADAVPQAIRTAITMLAAYMYEHRGCAASNAFNDSGAKELLTPYMNEVITL